MGDDFLKDMVNSTMNIYKTAFEEGRKAGDREGYLRGIREAQEIVNKTFKNDKKEE